MWREVSSFGIYLVKILKFWNLYPCSFYVKVDHCSLILFLFHLLLPPYSLPYPALPQSYFKLHHTPVSLPPCCTIKARLTSICLTRNHGGHPTVKTACCYQQTNPCTFPVAYLQSWKSFLRSAPFYGQINQCSICSVKPHLLLTALLPASTVAQPCLYCSLSSTAEFLRQAGLSDYCLLGPVWPSCGKKCC